MDFEGPQTEAFKDALHASVMAYNVDTMPREQEGAALFSPMSKLEVESTRLAIQDTLTIEMWTRPDELPSDQFGLFDAFGQYQLNLESDGQIECMLLGAGYDELESKTEIDVREGLWHHVACTYDGDTLKVFVDGKVTGCKRVDRTVTTLGTRAAIGANLAQTALVNRFAGRLDNVHVYSRALTPAEICDAWGYGGCDDKCPRG